MIWARFVTSVPGQLAVIEWKNNSQVYQKNVQDGSVACAMAGSDTPIKSSGAPSGLHAALSRADITNEHRYGQKQPQNWEGARDPDTDLSRQVCSASGLFF